MMYGTMYRDPSGIILMLIHRDRKGLGNIMVAIDGVLTGTIMWYSGLVLEAL